MTNTAGHPRFGRAPKKIEVKRDSVTTYDAGALKSMTNTARAPLQQGRPNETIGVKVIKRSTTATVVALLALLMAAAPAMATTEQFYNGGVLGAGSAFASGSAHTNVENSHKDGFGVTCPAVAAGYGGTTGNPNSGGNFTAGSNCGTGDRIWHPNGTSCCTFHGAVWNQTFGAQVVDFGRYTW